MEYIILGFILFILGVGGTLVYDKFKENKNKEKEKRAVSDARMREFLKTPQPQSTPRRTAKDLTVEDLKKLMQDNRGRVTDDLDAVNDELQSLSDMLDNIFDD